MSCREENRKGIKRILVLKNSTSLVNKIKVHTQDFQLTPKIIGDKL